MEFIAHRAGNTIAKLKDAEPLVDVIEVDVHLGLRGETVEARHAKRLWFTSRVWERWYLEPAGTAGVPLSDLLDAAASDTHFWLDLKGFTTRLSRRTLDGIGSRRPLTVSTKGWWLLRPFAGLENVRTIRSAGNRFELALLLWSPWWAKVDGAVVNHRLLTDDVLARLTARGLLFTWNVHDREAIERLRRAGVDGVILDDLSLRNPALGDPTSGPEG